MPRVSNRRKNQTLLLTLILLNLRTTGAEVRHKRYLVYPDGAPARAQFILGLGIPVDIKEAAVTVGTVIKFQYDLPLNSTEYTSRIYGFANTISRDMVGNPDINQEANQIDIEDSRATAVDENFNENDEDENNTLIDLTFDSRKKRSLAYAEGGYISGIDLSEEKVEQPLDEAIKIQEQIDENDVEGEPQRMNRWDFYKILEHMSERYGYTGRPCLLRTICEAAEVPFTHENGLLAEIGHILFTCVVILRPKMKPFPSIRNTANCFTAEIRKAVVPTQMTLQTDLAPRKYFFVVLLPSTTTDSLSHHTDNEYHAAERLGRDSGVDCESLFPECEGSILETFTEIGEDTLHRFGFK